MIAGDQMQFAGLVLAVVTFGTIGIGHILVRRLQARFGTRPAIVFFVLGLLVLWLSLISAADLLSAVLGITAVTLIWDGVEIYRQEGRMRREVQR
jgi:hypothetical protein